MRERFNKVLKKYAIILGICLAYLVFVLCTDIKIPCLFFLVTNLQCPGCGITRMFVSIARCEFVTAFNYNPFLFVCLPLILLCVIYWETTYVLTGKATMGKLAFLPYLLLIVALVFGVLRNVL